MPKPLPCRPWPAAGGCRLFDGEAALSAGMTEDGSASDHTNRARSPGDLEDWNNGNANDESEDWV